MLYKATVEKGTLDLIKQLCTDEKIKDFTLVGGTALALQIGHRISVDIDLFARSEFDSGKLAAYLKKNYNAEIVNSFNNTVFSFIGNIKVDMLTHPYDWLQTSRAIENIRMASLDDIAAMKVHAIVNSGARMRDFADIAFLLEHRTLGQILKAYTDKYPLASAEIARLGLLYYDEISKKTDINYTDRAFTWAEIENRIKEAVVNPNKIFNSSYGQDLRKPDDQKKAQRKNRGRTR